MKKVSSFKKRLNEAIEDANTTQYKLSKLTGVPQTTMSNYLHGNYQPKRKNLEKIAKYLKVPEMWLLGYNVPKQMEVKTKSTIIAKLDQMSASQLKKVNKIIDIIFTTE